MSIVSDRETILRETVGLFSFPKIVSASHRAPAVMPEWRPVYALGARRAFCGAATTVVPL